MNVPSQILKIAVIGPESTGKSTMAQHLAKHYNTVWVPEYARKYCDGLSRECTLQDEINMFYGQLEWEKELLPKANKLLICDVTILNVKIWCDEVFGGSPDFVNDEVKKRHYDLYLLMHIDTDWEEDPQRNFRDKRQYFFDLYERELKGLNANYKIISGLGDARFQNAINVIDRFLKRL